MVDQDDKNSIAIASIASLYLNKKDWANARRWYAKLIAVDPSNKDAYYSLGFIAWSEWYPAYNRERMALNMKWRTAGSVQGQKGQRRIGGAVRADHRRGS